MAPDRPPDPDRPSRAPGGGDQSSTRPEPRNLRWTPPGAPSEELADAFEITPGRLPIDHYVLAMERWAVAVRRLQAGVVDPAEREALLAQSQTLSQFREIPSRLPSPWVEWLQRLVRRFRGGGQGDRPPQPQAR